MSEEKQYYSIQEDTGHCMDATIYLGYELCTEGSTREELIANAIIWSVDQDGVEHDDEPLAEFSEKIQNTCIAIIDRHLKQ